MRDQWKRTESKFEASGNGRAKRRKKSTKGRQSEDEGKSGGRLRRSPRQHRLDRLHEYETERMLWQAGIEESVGE